MAPSSTTSSASDSPDPLLPAGWRPRRRAPERGPVEEPESPWIAFLAIALLGGLFALQRFTDHDVLWHVRTGEWILDEQRIPHTDVFAGVSTATPWIDVAWGAQVLAALVARVSGLLGLQLAAVVLVIATLVALAGRVRRTPLVLVAFLCAVLTAWQRFLVRPDLLSFPLVLVLLSLLEEPGERPWRTVVGVGILGAAWANLHGSFVLVPLLALAALAGAILAGDGTRTILAHGAAAAVAIVAPVLNPYGPRIYNLLEPYLHALLAAAGVVAPAGRLSILEWVPTWDVLFRDPAFPTWPLVCLTLVLGLSFATVRDRRGLWRLPPALVLLGLAFLAIRHVLPLAAGALWIVAANERDRFWRGVRLLPLPAGWRKPVTIAIGVAVLAVALWLGRAVLSNAFYLERDIPSATGVGVNLELAPEGAVQWLAAHQAPGRVFNNFNSGSYLLYRLFPVVRPYIDPRVVSMERYREVDAAVRDPALFAELLERDDIVTVVLLHPSAESLSVLPALAADPAWTLVFRDFNSTIHVRTDFTPVPPRAPPVDLPPAVEPAAQRINVWLERFRAGVLPAAELTEAFVAGVLGERERQIDACRRALHRAPDSQRAREQLEALVEGSAVPPDSVPTP